MWSTSWISTTITRNCTSKRINSVRLTKPPFLFCCRVCWELSSCAQSRWQLRVGVLSLRSSSSILWGQSKNVSLQPWFLLHCERTGCVSSLVWRRLGLERFLLTLFDESLTSFQTKTETSLTQRRTAMLDSLQCISITLQEDETKLLVKLENAWHQRD